MTGILNCFKFSCVALLMSKQEFDKKFQKDFLKPVLIAA